MPSALFQPLALRGVELPNRVVVSPMCQYSATDGSASDWHLMHLGQYLVSGIGLVIMEMTNVEARGRISPYCVGLWSDENEQALARVVEFGRRWGNSPLAVQIGHAGRKASTLPPWQGRKSLGPSDPLGWEIVAPSALPAEPTSQVPREMTRDDIRAMVDAFAQSTRRAARAGFDVVELHGAHGYLLHQFLSPISNRRTDEYGGSLENRMRFTLEVFDAARAEFPADRPLGIRVSASDWVEGGWTPDETVELARVLAARGCDFIDVSSGGLSPDQKMTVGPGYQVPLAAKVRAATGMVTMAVGMITEARQAEAIVAEGKADLVALARGMLWNPHWAWHAATALGVPDAALMPNQYGRGRP